MNDGTETQMTVFEAVGGGVFFEQLVAAFYRGVATDPLLRPMYPEADLAPAAERLRLFLEQYWGGPATYSERRGHPRLRMRHAPFPVDRAASDRWLAHMSGRRSRASSCPCRAAPPALPCPPASRRGRGR